MPTPADSAGRTARVGIVVVSHSQALARGVVEVAREMAGPELAIEAVGGAGERLGTDATQVMAALQRARGDGGVLVLADLGGAVLGAEAAIDLLGWTSKDALVSPGPMVEGAIAAAVSASGGADLERVAAEARSALGAKRAQMGVLAGTRAEQQAAPPIARGPGSQPAASWSFKLNLAHGLHARPAARMVVGLSGMEAGIEVWDITSGAGPADATSLSELVGLGASEGHELVVGARGADATRAMEALKAIVAGHFGEISPEARGPTAPGGGQSGPGASASEPAGATSRLSTDQAGEPGTGVIMVRGLAASPGAIQGPIHRLRFEAVPLSPPPGGVPDASGGRPADASGGGGGQGGWKVLDRALKEAAAELGLRRSGLEARGMEDAAQLVEVQRMLLEDRALIRTARIAIDRGLPAGEAWGTASAEATERIGQVGDPYLAARASDLRAAAALVSQYLGAAPVLHLLPLDAPAIAISSPLDPATLAELDMDMTLGLAIVGGSPADHLAIMARSLEIPAVVGLPPSAFELADGSPVLLDGDRGLLEVLDQGSRLPPGRSLQGALAERRSSQVRRGGRGTSAGPGRPAITRDGRAISVLANASTVSDAVRAVANGADGIGLLRSELTFARWEHLPGVEEQLSVYRKVARVLGNRPMVVRTLDVGADKPVRFLSLPPEPNPALGKRGLRLGLAHPELLDTQLRALQQLAEDRPVRVMVPMVTTPGEMAEARHLLEAAGRGAESSPESPHSLNQAELGAMVEVPAAALMARALAEEAAFLSIGTNDLCQYVMAADRQNAAVASLADAVSPAVLSLVSGVARAGAQLDRPVAVCGELASDPVAIPLLVGLGVGELSVRPGAVAQVKEAVRHLDAALAEQVALEALGLRGAAEVRELVAGSPAAGAKARSRARTNR